MPYDDKEFLSFVHPFIFVFEYEYVEKVNKNIYRNQI